MSIKDCKGLLWIACLLLVIISAYICEVNKQRVFAILSWAMFFALLKNIPKK